MKEGRASWRRTGFACAIGGFLSLSPSAARVGAEEARKDGSRGAMLDRPPAELHGQLLAQQAGERSRVEPGLHPSEDGTTFLYGGPAFRWREPAKGKEADQPPPAPYTTSSSPRWFSMGTAPGRLAGRAIR
jgi:hypothetical protein